ncbi:Gmad2 immunoglobulin-like domain-containing protein [Nocardioides sp. MAHUQ-72]|uniref:Gmad2 immunoglobulin-like domain-containing protein n=1 Tax=unclassified Nocardioides TaxID=2615069 RepID=UPI00360EA31F
MTEPRDPGRQPDESRLSELLSDAVSDVEPREALDSIRNRTKVTPMSARRPWTYAVGGAVVATAVVVGAIAVAGDQLGLTGSGDDTPAASQHPRHTRGEARASESPSPDSSASSEPSASASPSTPTRSTMAAYYLGGTPQGPRLFREFDQVEAADPVQGALALLTAQPHDPDYQTPWHPGDFSGGTEGEEFVDIEVSDALAERPSGMSPQAAGVAVQQVVYTVQAAVQSRKPVRFSVDTLLGVDTTEPVTNADPLDTLSLVSVSDPEEGSTVSGSFTASGVASSFEATVPWEVRRGDTVVTKGSAMADGWMDKLYPWQSKVDVSDLAPGEYTFVAMTDDPSGGEGPGPFVDTRTIVVE